MSRYTATVERDGNVWMIHVPELDRYTQARNLREVDSMARDMIALMDDLDPAAIELTVDLVLDERVRRHLQKAAEQPDYPSETSGPPSASRTSEPTSSSRPERHDRCDLEYP